MEWISKCVDRIVSKRLPSSTEYVDAHSENARKNLKLETEKLLREVVRSRNETGTSGK
jgi:hypothetical protein